MPKVFRRRSARPAAGNLARIADAVERVTGVRPREGDVDAGAALCDGVALDDRNLGDRSFVLAVPAVVHAVQAGGVHLLAPTQHEAAHHAAWLRPVAEQLGLRVSLLEPGDGQDARARHHAAEIVCGEVDEFAYDVLRNSLAWKDEHRVAATPRVAVVDQIDTVLLDRGDWSPFISGPEPVQHDWHRWAETVAPQLDRGHHVDRHERRAVLTPTGIDHLLERIELSTVLAEHVPVFDLVTAAVAVHDCYRSGRDYDIRDGEVVGADQLPDHVRDAIAVHEGLPVTTTSATLAVTTVRRHLLLYGLVTGIGVIAGAAARQLRELYGLRPRVPRADAPAGDDIVFDDDESRMRAVLAATRAAGDRPVLHAAATAELAAAVRGAGETAVLCPRDPVPAGRQLLIGIGRNTARRRDIRLARATEEARFYVTRSELTSMAGPDASHKLRTLRTGMPHPKTTALVAKLQEGAELVRFYGTELGRVVADVRDAHHEQLDSHRAALDSVEAFRHLMHEHLDRLIDRHRHGELGYPDLLNVLGKLYPCDLPADQPDNLPTTVRADADRALAQRTEEIETTVGDGAMARLILLVGLSLRHTLWRGHIVDLGTLSTFCGVFRLQRRPAEFTKCAAERLPKLLAEFDDEAIRLTFHVEAAPAKQ